MKAVRGQLDDSQLLGLSYNWQEVRQSMPGDVDGLVVGWLRGDSRQQVVVVCEAKYDSRARYALRPVLGPFKQTVDDGCCHLGGVCKESPHLRR